MLPFNTLLHVEPVKNELSECRGCLDLLKNEMAEAHLLASAMLGQLMYKWAYAVKARQNAGHPHYESIRRSIDFMHKNLASTCTIAALAKISGLGERRFRQVFQEITGMQPKRYLDEIRMDLAEELLTKTSMKLLEISDRLGYSSAYHFSRAFKKHCGVSPSVYRQ